MAHRIFLADSAESDPAIPRGEVEKNTGLPVRFAAGFAATPPPTAGELVARRDLPARTARGGAA